MSEELLTTELVVRQRRKLEPADYIIASGVAIPILYDFFAWRKGHKTVSVRFGNFLDDPISRTICVSSWAILTCHLFMKLPLPFQTTLKRVVITKSLKSGKEVVEWNV